ncbi:major facilitator superfamily permease [Streptantibioticus cattleyicolor NRRL 8057 = DSM 46488]|uniref:Major facilitator superfamily permease n=1 Tax=Streptantibioticus cattleyicolor (strain ATCC 35852 / DSM 46488 / JCM 4925 / NBRC 14057 / NRRL 8057) TaxID=1003195 RepID=G8WVT8_STREN|nr:major facilitator superfamily permease [Streptantibioticus cattleyicolor NRRL 8057 = DSM 46488]
MKGRNVSTPPRGHGGPPGDPAERATGAWRREHTAPTDPPHAPHPPHDGLGDNQGRASADDPPGGTPRTHLRSATTEPEPGHTPDTPSPRTEDTSAASGAPAPDAHRWPALAVCLVAGFMTLLDISIVNVALPSIRNGLHTPNSALQWVLSGYALTYGLMLVPAGRLGDARSRRGVFMVGLVLFTATSALAGAAQNDVWLVLARLAQGLSAGVLMPQVSGFIQQLFRGPERGRAFGLLGATIGVSTAVGPLLGGLLIQAFGAQEGWRWVFYVNLPIGIAALPFAYRLLPRHPYPAPGHQGERAQGSERKRGRFDPLGVVLLGAGTAALLLPLVQEQQWHGSGKWLLILVAAVLLAAFVGWEHHYGRNAEPLVDLGLFRASSYSHGALLSLVYFAGFTAIFFIFTLYLQNGLHYSALLAGLSITPFALGSGGAAAVGGRVVHRFGRPLVVVGLIMVAVGLCGAAVAVHIGSGPHVGWLTAAPLLFAGIGSGLVISPNQTLTLSEVPVARAGSAGGVLQTGQRIGSAVGIAAVGSVFFAHIASHHGDWAGALDVAVSVSVAFVLLALLIALIDVFSGRLPKRSARHRPAHARSRHATHPGPTDPPPPPHARNPEG